MKVTLFKISTPDSLGLNLICKYLVIFARIKSWRSLIRFVRCHRSVRYSIRIGSWKSLFKFLPVEKGRGVPDRIIFVRFIYKGFRRAHFSESKFINFLYKNKDRVGKNKDGRKSMSRKLWIRIRNVRNSWDIQIVEKFSLGIASAKNK